jgi:hypothetical protein
MEIAILSTALGIVLFLCFLYAFKNGLRLSKIVSEGKDIPKTKTPLEAIKEYKTEKELEKKDKEFQDGMKAILEYDPDNVE